MRGLEEGALMKTNYANAILKLRAKLNISQKKLSEILDVSFSTVNRWENGYYEPTKIAKIKLQELFEKNNIDLQNEEAK